MTSCIYASLVEARCYAPPVIRHYTAPPTLATPPTPTPLHAITTPTHHRLPSLLTGSNVGLLDTNGDSVAYREFAFSRCHVFSAALSFSETTWRK